MEPAQLAAVLAAAIVLASMVSVEFGITVALVELTFGIALSAGGVSVSQRLSAGARS